MSRPNYNTGDRQNARINYLRRAVLKAERTLARETKKRAMPCRCQGGGYEFSQEDFEEVREIYETARTRWFADHDSKTYMSECG